MKVLHVISGGETGGSRKHLITLLTQFPKDEVVLSVFQEGTLAKEAREQGIRVELFSQSSRYDLSILNKMVSFIKEERFDLVHTHGPRANLFGIYIKKKTNLKWVTTIHSDPSLDFVKSGVKGTIFTKIHMYAVKKMDHYFAVSERFKDNLVKLGISPDKIQTVYNGITFTEEKAQPINRVELGLDDSDFVMTMVARLHPIKGHAIVFDALRKIKNQKVKLLLVGDGPIREELKNTVNDLQLDDQVTFLGFRKDVDHLLATSDISILCSFSESFPLSLLESANQHIPLISTDVGGVKELIDHEETGWIVPVDDSERYRRAIEEAYEQSLVRNLPTMGDKLYQYASRRFSLKQLYEITVEVYSNIISKN